MTCPLKPCPKCLGYGLDHDAYPERVQRLACSGSGEVVPCDECGECTGWCGEPLELTGVGGLRLCPVCVECGSCGERLTEVDGTRLDGFLVCPKGRCLDRAAREADRVQRDAADGRTA